MIYLFSDTTAQQDWQHFPTPLVLLRTLRYSRWNSDSGLLGARRRWRESQFGLTFLAHSVCEAGRSERRTDSQGWEMGGQCVRFSIMTHRCSITLQIKSKMLNFNQAPLMAWCEEWLLCLRWQEGERGWAKSYRKKPRWNKRIWHFNSPNCMLARNQRVYLMIWWQRCIIKGKRAWTKYHILQRSQSGNEWGAEKHQKQVRFHGYKRIGCKFICLQLLCVEIRTAQFREHSKFNSFHVI